MIIEGDILKAVFGVRPRLPLIHFPPGKVRIKLRPKEFAIAYVKSDDGIQSFFVGECNGYWTPMYGIGSNIKEKA
jgi:hypothetical protein